MLEQEGKMKTRDVCAVILFILCAASLSWAQAPGPHNAITDVPGIKVGHYTGTYLTGTTVVLAENGGLGGGGGVAQRGGAPGTRETDLLRPENMVDKVNAVVLSGGSAYGLAAASGVMKCLQDQKIGWDVGGGNVVPIAPSAILFDPGRCDAPFDYRPDFSFGLQACQAAAGGPVEEGNVGAGAGAVSGGVKGGIGTASVVLNNGIIVGAIVAVNSVGSAFDERGNLYAASLEMGKEFRNVLHDKVGPWPSGADEAADVAGPVPEGLLRNTTIAVVATNVQLTKAQATKIAQMADDGLGRALRPTHTPYDGDTVFALGTGRITMQSLGDPSFVEYQIGSAAADALSRAIVHAILAAESTPCYKSYCLTFPKACRIKMRR
jgi:L-aminopeptidase/D-esterase-like protein